MYTQSCTHLFSDFSWLKKPKSRGRNSLTGRGKEHRKGREEKTREMKLSEERWYRGVWRTRGARRGRAAGVPEHTGQETEARSKSTRHHSGRNNELTYPRLPAGSTDQRWGWRVAYRSVGLLGSKWWPCEWHTHQYMTFSSKRQNCWRQGGGEVKGPARPATQPRAPRLLFSIKCSRLGNRAIPMAHSSVWCRCGLNMLPLT